MLIFLIGCLSNKSVNSGVSLIYDSLRMEGFVCEFNIDSTYLLCNEKKNTKNLQKVFVINLDDRLIVFDQNLSNPQLKWIDTFQIELNRSIGIMGDNNGRELSIINVKNNQKRILNTQSEKNEEILEP